MESIGSISSISHISCHVDDVDVVVSYLLSHGGLQGVRLLSGRGVFDLISFY